jgi:hypothetical protein
MHSLTARTIGESGFSLLPSSTSVKRADHLAAVKALKFPTPKNSIGQRDSTAPSKIYSAKKFEGNLMKKYKDDGKHVDVGRMKDGHSYADRDWHPQKNQGERVRDPETGNFILDSDGLDIVRGGSKRKGK